MCQSLAEGGRRCAAHTRPGFNYAISSVRRARTPHGLALMQAAGLDDVVAHATTPAGAVEVADLRERAERDHDRSMANFLAMAEQIAARELQERGDVDAEVQAALQARPRTPDRPTRPPRIEAGPHWSIEEGATKWHRGGCGAFAIAMVQQWPHLKIACEMYDDGPAGESVMHAWAYDPNTRRRFHIFGAEKWRPTKRPSYNKASRRVLLDQTPDDVQRLFRGEMCDDHLVADATEVAREMFDPDYRIPAGQDRRSLYFWPWNQ